MIKVNGVVLFAAPLTEPENRIEISIPQAMQQTRLIRVELTYRNPVRPKDIGLNKDSRELALGLRSITVR
jgi:hypothetical protein